MRISCDESARASSESIMPSTMPTSVRVLGLFCLGLLACGREALSNAGPGANQAATALDASNPPPKRGDDASTGGVASVTSDDTGGDTRPCVVQQGASWGTGLQPTCADLDVLTVSDPVILDQSGDGKLSPGEDASLRVNLNEVAGVGFLWYPGVKFASDDANVSIKDNDWNYAILACTSLEILATIHVALSAKPGSIVHFTAQAAMISTDCPHAPALVIPVMIE